MRASERRALRRALAGVRCDECNRSSSTEVEQYGSPPHVAPTALCRQCGLWSQVVVTFRRQPIRGGERTHVSSLALLR